MPELPEVQAILDYFRRTALGRTIRSVTVSVPNMIKSPRAATFARSLRGRKMVDAVRRGKYLIITLDDSRILILHFGMGGELAYLRKGEEPPPYTRILFHLDKGDLAFTCPRKICRVMLTRSLEEIPALRTMGPEPLTSSWSMLHLSAIIERSPRRQVKPLLMDQSRVAGVGNIYADQILFEAGVRPDRLSSTLSEIEIKRIHSETRRVLRKALKTANEETFPFEYLFSRKNRRLPCGRCGTEIERKTIAGRTAHFCPSCQV